MSKAKNNNKKKIAIALMSTLFCAGNGNRNNISAMHTIEKNKTQNPQTLAAVRGGTLDNKNTKISNTTKGLLALLGLAVLVTTGVIVVKNCSGKNNDEDKDKKINEQEINKRNIKNDLKDTSEKDILENKNKNKKVVTGDEKSKLNSKEAKKKNILKRISQCWEGWYYKSKYEYKGNFAFVVQSWRISNVMSKISEKVADYENSGLLDKITAVYVQNPEGRLCEVNLNSEKGLCADGLKKLADIFSGESEPSEINVDFIFEAITENKYWMFDFKHQGDKESKLELKLKKGDEITLKYTIDRIEITIKFPFNWLLENKN